MFHSVAQDAMYILELIVTFFASQYIVDLTTSGHSLTALNGLSPSPSRHHHMTNSFKDMPVFSLECFEGYRTLTP